MSPLANAYISEQELDDPEVFYPLRALVCERCLLVQLHEYGSPTAIFSEYAYFSSYSTTWVEHARGYAEDFTARLGLDQNSMVVEVASNDGYLLEHFRAHGVPVLGVEPAANVAKVAIKKGIPTIVEFFGPQLAAEIHAGSGADLLVANNVIAHVPDLNGFVEGLSIALKPDGLATIEFPHLLRLVEEGQFDTIYHEHLCYLSLRSVRTVLERHGLSVVDVDELPTHGGSLRVHARHAATAPAASLAVAEVLAAEQAAGLHAPESYDRFSAQVRDAKRDLLAFLIEQKRSGRNIVGYGAPAKATTLLNYCGIGTDFLDYTVDVSPAKQGRLIPGCRVPIMHPDEIRRTKPDIVLILPWNIRDEIMEQLAYVRDWGGRFAARAPGIGFLG